MDDLRDRVEADERALTDGEGDLAAFADGVVTAERVEALEAAVDAIEADLAELEAAAQALRGFVGNVRSVNESVENRADAALATVEALEERVDALEAGRVRDVGTAPHHWRRGRHDASTRRTCGKPEPDRATSADRDPSGSRVGAFDAPDPGRGSQKPDRTSSADARTRRETIGGFAPDADVDRDSLVTGPDDAVRRPARPATGRGSSDEPGLLGRLRGLL